MGSGVAHRSFVLCASAQAGAQIPYRDFRTAWIKWRQEVVAPDYGSTRPLRKWGVVICRRITQIPFGEDACYPPERTCRIIGDMSSLLLKTLGGQMSYRFEWDRRKTAINIRKQSVGFHEASAAFDDPLVAIFDGETHYLSRQPQR